jgi:hypothetical protein
MNRPVRQISSKVIAEVACPSISTGDQVRSGNRRQSGRNGLFILVMMMGFRSPAKGIKKVRELQRPVLACYLNSTR